MFRGRNLVESYQLLNRGSSSSSSSSSNDAATAATAATESSFLNALGGYEHFSAVVLSSLYTSSATAPPRLSSDIVEPTQSPTARSASLQQLPLLQSPPKPSDSVTTVATSSYQGANLNCSMIMKVSFSRSLGEEAEYAKCVYNLRLSKFNRLKSDQETQTNMEDTECSD